MFFKNELKASLWSDILGEVPQFSTLFVWYVDTMEISLCENRCVKSASKVKREENFVRKFHYSE